MLKKRVIFGVQIINSYEAHLVNVVSSKKIHSQIKQVSDSGIKTT